MIRTRGRRAVPVGQSRECERDRTNYNFRVDELQQARVNDGRDHSGVLRRAEARYF